MKKTQDIHNFVRGHLSWEESLRLLDEIIESEEWIQHLVIDMLFSISELTPRPTWLGIRNSLPG